MFKTRRQWIQFYLTAKYGKGFASKVMCKTYEAYLKQNKYEDKHGILK